MSVSFSNIVLTPGSATLTTKGDILTHNGTNPARLGIGADGAFLQAQSSASLGLSWRTTALGQMATLDLFRLQQLPQTRQQFHLVV